MITLNNVKKIYKTNKKNIYAINDICIHFESNKLYAIVGPSGSGKTTLLNIIGLIDRFDDGEVIIDNKIVKNNTSEKKLIELRKNKIGFIFQDFLLNNELTAFENVIIPLFLKKDLKYQEKKEIVDEKLKEFDIFDRKNHFPKELSGGEQQRVAIARALINDPKIILADEPTGNLDSKNEIKVFKCLKKISQKGCCVIVTSHSEKIKKYADTIIYIENGQVIKYEHKK